VSRAGATDSSQALPQAEAAGAAGATGTTDASGAAVTADVPQADGAAGAAGVTEVSGAGAAGPAEAADRAERAPVAAGVALRARLALTAPALRATTARLWRPDGLAGRYLAYLAVMHGVLRASVPLMERAAARCAELGDRDPVAAPLERYLLEHIEEERGHDNWLLDDLAALGGRPADVLAEQPSPTVARLVGAQYYWIEHHHPVALLGYIAVLEDNAPAGWLADRVADTAGVPDTALRTLREHAELDDGHTAALFGLLDTLPLSRRLERAVAVSALHTVDGLIDLFARVEREPGPEHADGPAGPGDPSGDTAGAPLGDPLGDRLGGGVHRP